MTGGGGVDVLAVLDAAISKVEASNSTIVYRGGQAGFVAETSDQGLREAHAAIAELIAADKEYDEARKAWENAPGCVQAIGDYEARDYESAEYVRYDRATARRASALAAVGQS